MLSSVIVSPWTGASQTTGLRSMSACVSAHFMSCTFFFQLQLYTCFFPPVAASVAFKKRLVLGLVGFIFLLHEM